MGTRRAGAALSAVIVFVLVLAACGGSGDQTRNGVTSITVGALTAPSLGSFLPPIIKAQKLDAQNGLDLKFTYSPNDAYNLSYTSGQFPVGASASLVQEALRWQQGVQSVYLFNVFDFWTGFLTKDPNVKSLSDLRGKSVGMTLGSSNYALSEWFLKQAGVDVGQFKVVNLTSSALGPALEAGQVAAINTPEPGYDTALGVDPGLHAVPLDLQGIWKKKFSTAFIPFLGVAALPDWVSSHKAQIAPLYKTYQQAANWAITHPDQASQIIAKTIPGGQTAIIQSLFSTNKARLALDVRPATQIKRGLSGVIDAGLATGYLKQRPGSSFLSEEVQ